MVMSDDKISPSLRWYRKNREKAIARQREWRAKNLARARQLSREWNKNNKEKIKESNRAYYQRHKERKAAEKREWRKRNPEKAAEIKKKWMAKNTEKVAASQWRRRKTRRAREYGAEGKFCEHQIKWLWRKQFGLCYYCAASLENEYEIDHVIPLSKGGTNWLDNLALACQPCNRSKGAKTEGWGQHWVHHQG